MASCDTWEITLTHLNVKMSIKLEKFKYWPRGVYARV